MSKHVTSCYNGQDGSCRDLLGQCTSRFLLHCLSQVLPQRDNYDVLPVVLWARYIQCFMATKAPLSPVLRKTLTWFDAWLPYLAYESSICTKGLRKCVSRRYLETKPILDSVFCHPPRIVATHSPSPTLSSAGAVSSK